MPFGDQLIGVPIGLEPGRRAGLDDVDETIPVPVPDCAQDPAEAGRLLSRLKALESENEDLHARLEQGREGVERVLARIRFLEEQR